MGLKAGSHHHRLTSSGFWPGTGSARHSVTPRPPAVQVPRTWRATSHVLDTHGCATQRGKQHWWSWGAGLLGGAVIGGTGKGRRKAARRSSPPPPRLPFSPETQPTAVHTAAGASAAKLAASPHWPRAGWTGEKTGSRRVQLGTGLRQADRQDYYMQDTHTKR